MNLGLTQNDVRDPNLLNKKYEELDARFNKLPVSVSVELSDQIRDNLSNWGEFYWNHPTGFSDPRSGGGPDEPAYAIKGWCRDEQAGCAEGTRWNQVYRQTLVLLEKAEAATAGQESLQPSEASGEIVQQQEVDITGKKPLWWLLVPVVFMLGGALMIKTRKLRSAAPLPEPVSVDGVDDVGATGDVEDCGCDGGGDDVLKDFPIEHLARGAHAINNMHEQINLLKENIDGQTCETVFSDLQWAETFRAIANDNIRAVTDDPEASEEEISNAKKATKRLEKVESDYKELEDSFRTSCLQ